VITVLASLQMLSYMGAFLTLIHVIWIFLSMLSMGNMSARAEKKEGKVDLSG